MAERSLYDVLEVSNTASPEVIQAAYERLAAKFEPAQAQAQGASDAAARMQYDALRQAYLTLSNIEGRAQYDRRLQLRAWTPQREAVVAPFWTAPKLLIIGVIALCIGGGYHVKQKKEEARVEAERVIALAKSKEAEALAKAEAEQRMAVQVESERERGERMEAARLRRERDADLRQVQRDAMTYEVSKRIGNTIDRAQVQNDEYKRRAEEARIKREEAQAANASRQQLARDRAELCRIEYERYGKSISC